MSSADSRQPARMPSPCHFEDSAGTCFPAPSRGACGRPAAGRPAFVQGATVTELCEKNPPYGFGPLCRAADSSSSLRMLRGLRDPARCFYRSCAVVGASGNLLGSRYGAEIDSHDAVVRINLAPDGPMTARSKAAPHRHEPTWISDVGARTTWRVLTMEGYGYLTHYSRFWLAPPHGHGSHPNMSGVPQDPLLAVVCHEPGRNMGRCRAERLAHTFAHSESASYLINPGLLGEIASDEFRGVRGQKTPSTGMVAIALARKMCGAVHLYGFGNGSCGSSCYHFYECTASGSNPSQDHFLNVS
uniref:Uncharacterized protein n=1 Tax=Emiliania huxleyi TaxID=2903 RepID=A0A7S3S2R4_EMIHU